MYCRVRNSFGSNMFDVTVGDGIVNRLGCALVVIEKMRGLERVEIAIRIRQHSPFRFQA